MQYSNPNPGPRSVVLCTLVLKSSQCAVFCYLPATRSFRWSRNQIFCWFHNDNITSASDATVFKGLRDQILRDLIIANGNSHTFHDSLRFMSFSIQYTNQEVNLHMGGIIVYGRINSSCPDICCTTVALVTWTLAAHKEKENLVMQIVQARYSPDHTPIDKRILCLPQ